MDETPGGEITGTEPSGIHGDEPLTSMRVDLLTPWRVLRPAALRAITRSVSTERRQDEANRA